MRSRAEDLLWFVVAASSLVVPVVGVVAIAVLALLALTRREARSAVWRTLQRWPIVWWLGVPALAMVHAVTGAVWWDLVGVTGWALAAATVLAVPASRARRAAIVTGAAFATAVTFAVVAPELGAGRVTGLVGHPNLLAAALALIGPLLLVTARREGAGWSWIGVAAAVGTLAIAWATGSRALLLGTVLGASAWAVLVPVASYRGRAVRGLAVALLAAGGLIVASVRGFDPTALFTTDVERGVVQGVALTLAAERPVLGHGGAAWPELAARVEPSVPTSVLVHAHAVVLHLLARGGAVAVGLVVVLLLAATPAVVAVLRRIAHRDPWSALALSVAIGVLLVQGAVDLVVQHPAVYVGAWVLLVAAADAGRVVSSAPVDEGSDP